MSDIHIHVHLSGAAAQLADGDRGAVPAQKQGARRKRMAGTIEFTTPPEVPSGDPPEIISWQAGTDFVAEGTVTFTKATGERLVLTQEDKLYVRGVLLRGSNLNHVDPRPWEEQGTNTEWQMSFPNAPRNVDLFLFLHARLETAAGHLFGHNTAGTFRLIDQ